jgi:hypothetical protein
VEGVDVTVDVGDTVADDVHAARRVAVDTVAT